MAKCRKMGVYKTNIEIRGSINRGKDKEDVARTYNSVLFSHKKRNEVLLLAATWMDAENIMLSEWSQIQKAIFRYPYLKYSLVFYVLKYTQGLPWWRSGWESVCQCRGHGFKPWSGKIPHAAEQLSPWATITEPAHLEPVLRNKRGRDSERPAHRDEEWPPLAATGESPRTETKTQHSQK